VTAAEARRSRHLLQGRADRRLCGHSSRVVTTMKQQLTLLSLFVVIIIVSQADTVWWKEHVWCWHEKVLSDRPGPRASTRLLACHFDPWTVASPNWGELQVVPKRYRDITRFWHPWNNHRGHAAGLAHFQFAVSCTDPAVMFEYLTPLAPF
jgi:hypothetical protein